MVKELGKNFLANLPAEYPVLGGHRAHAESALQTVYKRFQSEISENELNEKMLH